MHVLEFKEFFPLVPNSQYPCELHHCPLLVFISFRTAKCWWLIVLASPVLWEESEVSGEKPHK